MDAAASHCGCGLHDHQRMLKRGQEKKQSGERQREKEGGRERGRKACWGHRSAQPIPRALLHVTCRVVHRFCQRPHWEFTYTGTHTRTLTHAHTHTHTHARTHTHTHTHTHTRTHSTHSTQLTLLWCSVLLLPEQKGTGLMGCCVLNIGNCP